MSAKIYTLGIVLLGLIVSGCATSYSDGGTASEESAFSNEVFNLEKITCWDLGTISEEDASYAATLLYGYAKGQKGEATQTPSKIENALGEISGKCAGNFDMLVIDTFK